VPHRGLAIFLDELGNHAPEQSRHAVQDLEHRTHADAQLVAQSPHRNPLPVMQKHHLRDQLIAVQTLRQYLRRARLHGLAATRAARPLQLIQDRFGP
jgi:hypothetical protein